jgi:hypothetical protein
MKNWMELRITRKRLLVRDGPHTLENGIRNIKFRRKILKMVIFE